MNLSELKQQNLEEEQKLQQGEEEAPPQPPEEKEDPPEEPKEDSVDEGAVEEEEELWLQEETAEEDEQASSKNVPEATLINLKQKLKGKIKERDEELEELRQERDQLKQQLDSAPPKVEALKRPRRSEFDDEDAYEDAMDAYEEQRGKIAQSFKDEEQKAKAYTERVAAAVDGHYGRASALVKEKGISPEAYQKADKTVRETIEEVLPERGEAVFNHLLTLMGEGSEKTMFYVGRNKTELEAFTSKLAKDKSGLEAAYHLGRLSQKVSGPVNKTSRARKPAPSADGDTLSTSKGKAAKRKYDEAHAKNKGAEAYRIKQEAKKAGVDTSQWS